TIKNPKQNNAVLSSSLGERKRKKASRSLKVPGFSERKSATLAGMLAGRACSLLESKVAV
ncbi:hypothetical protein A2U01_0105515, partial [Trifolium medium]|nr:hypothetical protein [Trifolium medium]